MQVNDPRAQAYALTEQAIEVVGKSLRHGCRGLKYGGLPNIDLADVVQALLARQYQMWVVGVLSPSSSTAPVYPLIARALVDAVITLAWIAEHPDAAEPFKLHSAGRLKLLAEHWRARDEATRD